MAKTFFAEKYRDGYPLPDMESKSVTEKQGPKYNAQVSQWLYSLYCQGKTEITSEYIDFIDKLRKYAAGKQDPNYYKTFFTGTLNQSTSSGNTINQDISRKGWMNVDWKNIMSFIPTLMNGIMGALSDHDYDIKADPIDYDSGIEEDKLMYKVYVRNTFAPQFNMLRQVANLPMEQQDATLTDFSELEQLRKDGIFKEPYIREHEKLIQHTEAISKWDNNLRPKLVQDLIITGYAFSHACYDYETHKVKWEYVDPKDVIMQYSKQDDFADADFGGFLRWTTISELRAKSQLITDGEKTGLSEQELYDIAKTYSGQYGNTELPNTLFETRRQNMNYDGFKVLEFVTYWRDVESKKELLYKKKNGRVRVYDYPVTPPAKLGDREEVRVIRKRQLYKSIWLVGTDFVYDYGRYPNQGIINKDPWFPIRGVRMFGYEEKSLVHRLMPVADLFHISWLKLMNGFSKATEGGYAIDTTRLALNDPKKFNPLEVMRSFIEGNFFFYKSLANGLNVGGSPVPISAIPGNLRELIEPYMNWLQWCVHFAENLTGIPLLMLGATPKPDTAVGVSEMSMQSAQNSLRPYIDCLKTLKEDLSEGTSQMIQCICKYDEIGKEEYIKVLGSANIQVIADASYPPIEYGIHLHARPTMAQRQKLIQLVELLVQNGRNGIPGLSPDQAAELEDQIMSGTNLGEVRHMMKKWVEKDRIRVQAEKEKLVQMQTEGNQKTVQMQQQSAMQIEAMRMQAMKIEKDLETRSKMIQRNFDSIKKIDEIMAEYIAKTGSDATLLKAENDLQNELTKNNLIQQVPSAQGLVPQEQQQASAQVPM